MQLVNAFTTATEARNVQIEDLLESRTAIVLRDQIFGNKDLGMLLAKEVRLRDESHARILYGSMANFVRLCIAAQINFLATVECQEIKSF
jgi:hypothetical protein